MSMETLEHRLFLELTRKQYGQEKNSKLTFKTLTHEAAPRKNIPTADMNWLKSKCLERRVTNSKSY